MSKGDAVQAKTASAVHREHPSPSLIMTLRRLNSEEEEREEEGWTDGKQPNDRTEARHINNVSSLIPVW